MENIGWLVLALIVVGIIVEDVQRILYVMNVIQGIVKPLLRDAIQTEDYY